MELRFLDALNFAALRHRNQKRKGAGAPYINHLIEVAHILATHGEDDPDLLCAAILHDTMEDVAVTFDELSRRFGRRVAEIVQEVTDDPLLPSQERRLRQEETAPMLSRAAQQLRVADKISNLRGVLVSPPKRWDHDRRREYYRWARRVVDGCELAVPSLRAMFDDVYGSGMAALDISSVGVRELATLTKRGDGAQN